jgi:hypothetical protein
MRPAASIASAVGWAADRFARRVQKETLGAKNAARNA